MLVIESVSVSFGGAHALRDVSIKVPIGGACAILGRNGAGKSTLLRTVGGLVPLRHGRITWNDRPLGGGAADAVRHGVRLVTESGNVFPDLTVRDNLRSALPMLSRRAMSGRVDETASTFPILAKLINRQAGNLSGGERQTLAVARALIARPSLLLLDEPGLGLAPALASTLLRHLASIVRERGVTVLIAEQNLRLAALACEVGCWLETGLVTARGPVLDLAKSVFGPDAQNTFLG